MTPPTSQFHLRTPSAPLIGELSAQLTEGLSYHKHLVGMAIGHPHPNSISVLLTILYPRRGGNLPPAKPILPPHSLVYNL